MSPTEILGLFIVLGFIVFLIIGSTNHGIRLCKKITVHIVRTKQGFIKLAKKSPAWFLFSIGYVIVYCYVVWNLIICVIIDLDLKVIRRYYMSDLINERIYHHYDHYNLIWFTIFVLLSLILYGLANIKFKDEY